jgi:N6-adenosine-specific RNA methylase IME4
VTWEGLTPPYSAIVADPPWMYQKAPGEKQPGGRATPGGRGGQAEHHYSTMTNEEILALPVRGLAAKQAHLYLWFTNPGAWGGRFSDVTPHDIAAAWGFEFKTIITWVKTDAAGGVNRGGMGWYFRGATEHVLFATRGDLQTPEATREPNVIMAGRGRHSEKPGAFFDLVQRNSPPPYVELFARAPRLGWEAWGKGYE